MWVWVVSLVTIPLWIANIPGDDWFRWARTSPSFCRSSSPASGASPPWSRRTRRSGGPCASAGCAGRCTASCSATSPRPRLRDVQMGNMMNAARRLHPVRHHAPRRQVLEVRHLEPRRDPVLHRAHVELPVHHLERVLRDAEGHEFFASTCCILAAAELYPIVMRRPELYITGRIYTLGAHLLLRSCFPALFPTIMNSAAWFNPDFMAGWGLFKTASSASRSCSGTATSCTRAAPTCRSAAARRARSTWRDVRTARSTSTATPWHCRRRPRTSRRPPRSDDDAAPVAG